MRKLSSTLSSRTAQPIRDLVPHMRKEIPALRYRFGGDDIVKKAELYMAVSSRTAVADPGSWDASALGGPRSALRSGGDDIVLVRYFVWKRFGDPSGPPNRNLNYSCDNWVDRFGETEVAPKRFQMKSQTHNAVIPDGGSRSGIL